MRRDGLVLIGYLAFFALLFLQFPLNSALPGNCDSWLLVALSNQYLLAFQKLFGAVAGGAMYPVSQVFSYGEASPGCCALFLLLKVFGLDDVWTYYLYLTLIFGLTGWAVYRFAILFMRPFPGALFAGFAFSCCNMTFAHIDDSIIYFYLIPLTAARLLVRFFRERRVPLLWGAMALGGLQIYFSLYVFVYQTVLLGALFIFFGWIKKEPIPWHDIGKAGSLYVLLPIPYLLFYLNTLLFLHYNDPFKLLYTARMTSLMPFDFVTALPENLLYGNLIDLPQNWGFVRHRNFIGFLLIGLGLYGLRRWNEHRMLFLFVIIGGLLFGIGPDFMYHPQAKVMPPAPLYPFYTWLPILSYLRVTHRAYFLVLLAFSLCAGLSLERIFSRVLATRRSIAFVVAAGAFLIHGIENIPMPFKRWPVGEYIPIPADYREFAASVGPEEVFLDVPTTFTMDLEDLALWERLDPREFVERKAGDPRPQMREVSMFTSSWDPLFQYNRELIYLYWQSQHRHSTVSGLNGYFPTPRVIYYLWSVRLPEPEAIGRLKRYGVTVLVYHKGMELKKDRVSLRVLESSPLLRKVFEGPHTVVFRFAE